MALAGALLLGLFFAYRPAIDDASSLDRVKANLRATLRLVTDLREQEGSYAGATPLRLRELRPSVLYIDPDEGSNDPNVVSLYATDTAVAAAARATTGDCLWARVDDQGTSYGTATDCSGDQASTEQGHPTAAEGWAIP